MKVQIILVEEPNESDMPRIFMAKTRKEVKAKVFKWLNDEYDITIEELEKWLETGGDSLGVRIFWNDEQEI